MGPNEVTLKNLVGYVSFRECTVGANLSDLRMTLFTWPELKGVCDP